MGTLKDSHNQAVLEKASKQDAGTYEWWTALSFEDGDLALEHDPVLAPADEAADEIEVRLYSL